jgi:hypothetical protein
MLGQDSKLPALTNLAKNIASLSGIAKAMCLGKPAIARNCQPGSAEILSGDYKQKSLKIAAAFSYEATKNTFSRLMAAALNQKCIGNHV